VNYSSASAGMLIGDPSYPALKRYVIESTGLAYYLDKDNDFASRLSARTSELGVNSCGDYLRLLKDDQKGESERHLLIGRLTIGETYFFRHSEQFAAMRDLIIPDLIERNASKRTLRIWSAGCSTGAEPYSISILLKQDFGDRIAGWDIQIFGTDLNQEFLARAKRGRFEEWAMRATPESVKRRWFSQDGNGWLIAPECRDWVSFQHHNLVAHPYPSLLHNLMALDLIVCRNVMIYFDAALMRVIADRFHDCLVDKGWLMVGHAEANVEIFSGYQTVNAPGTTLYQKDKQHVGNTQGKLWRLPQVPVPASKDISIGIPWSPPALPAIPCQPNPPEQRPKQFVDDIAAVRQLADEGKWKEAIARCDALLVQENLNPSLHFCRALLLNQMGRTAESERSLRRTIYLDRNFALGHFHLALVLQKNGDARAAAQSFKNARRVLAGIDKNIRLPDGDGITVAELQTLTEMQMEFLNK
jgi:chemotaxis protein methyltransferase CheR